MVEYIAVSAGTPALSILKRAGPMSLAFVCEAKVRSRNRFAERRFEISQIPLATARRRPDSGV